MECKTQWPGLNIHNYRQNLNQPRKQHKQAAPPNQLLVVGVCEALAGQVLQKPAVFPHV